MREDAFCSPLACNWLTQCAWDVYQKMKNPMDAECEAVWSIWVLFLTWPSMTVCKWTDPFFNIPVTAFFNITALPKRLISVVQFRVHQSFWWKLSRRTSQKVRIFLYGVFNYWILLIGPISRLLIGKFQWSWLYWDWTSTNMHTL